MIAAQAFLDRDIERQNQALSLIYTDVCIPSVTRTLSRGRNDTSHMGLKVPVGSSTRVICLRAFPHVLREMEKDVGKQ